MMMVAHIDRLVDDYVLDLLSMAERRVVARHAARCPRCMELLSGERRRLRLWAATFRSATAAPAGRLEALWPAVAAAVAQSPRSTWWVRRRAAFATLAVAFLVLAGFVRTAEHIDGWLLNTYTPTAVRSASPTASTTPTRSTPLHAANPLTMDTVAYHSAGWGTPEPVLVRLEPQPKPNPPAPTTPGRQGRP
jgi:hypothetical protein